MRRYLLAMPLFVVLIALAGCTSRSPVNPARQEQQVERMGAAAAATLANTLFSRVTAAMQEGGPVYALDFCSLRAQPLTAEVDRQLDPFDIKRTTFQYRNPRNAPDQLEAEALNYFEQAMAETGAVPPDYVQFVNANEYRYYKSLVVQEGCLKCHGDPATFSPELTQVLNERYPNDKAVGYEEGDFRGVVRVSIPTRQLR